MSYQLGVDIGTSYSAAAISRGGLVELFTLTSSNPVMPSVVLLKASGEVLVGDAAVRRGLDEPARVARAFKRRLGDPTPLVLGGTPFGAEALMGFVLREIVRAVAERQGEVPDRVVLTHPANYGPYKVDQMREVARLGGLDLADVFFVTEPEAAAISYASTNRVEPGEVVAVYDFGGGTFDVALVRNEPSGFRLIGQPEGMDRLGGIDIDSAILDHIDLVLGGRISALDPSDPAVQGGVARLQDDCRIAKEILSTDSDTSVSVSLPGLQERVPLTRQQLEAMIGPRLVETVETLRRAVERSGLEMGDVGRVLLVGGSSRIPLVRATVQTLTGRPVSLDAHPKFAIAAGAASLDAASLGAASQTPVVPLAPTRSTVAGTPAPFAPPSPPPPAGGPLASMPSTPTSASAPIATPLFTAPTDSSALGRPEQAFPPDAAPASSRARLPHPGTSSRPPQRPNRTRIAAAAGVVAAMVVVAILVATRGGSDEGTATASVTTNAPATTTPLTTADASVASAKASTKSQPPALVPEVTIATTPSPTLPTATTTTAAAATVELDQSVWAGGLQIVVKSATYDPAQATLTVDATFENLSVVETSTLRSGLRFGVFAADTEFPGLSGANKNYPPQSGPVRDPFVIKGLPRDFVLGTATLFFGAQAEHRTTIELKPGAAAIGDAPRDLAVAGVLTLGYGATYTVHSGQFVPWECSANDSEHLAFKPAPKDEWSIILRGDYVVPDAPRGGLTFNSVGGGFTRLKLADGTTLNATSATGKVWNSGERELDNATCFSGVVAPGNGNYEMTMNDGTEPTGALDFAIP